ncbi:peroxiredoxin [Endozoicomonas sp. OPT23]|uniref:peroxiredoxin family protein n=1 Tax=Endozoicomonas sp. OPT23 TaxID=2072845 RepID=UPI00129A579C|nr:peroxiredoxin [Endozoicomonas sp. OPT23]MRI34790.1 peroxiredoxin [Endozoicomonas sp. OPT23]
MSIAIGDQLPDVNIFEYVAEGDETEGIKVWRLPDLVYKKKVLIVGLIGVFTPVCTNSHIPGYVEAYDHFHRAGIDEIWCISVNDPFVMAAFARDTGCGDKIRMLSDGSGELADHMGMTLDLSDRGMGVRSDRFAMIADNGLVVDLLREDPGCFCYTDASTMLERLEGVLQQN